MELRVEILHVERIQLVWASDQVASYWMFSVGVQLRGDPGLDPEHFGEIISSGLGMPWYLLGETGKWDTWTTLLSLLPL